MRTIGRKLANRFGKNRQLAPQLRQVKEEAASIATDVKSFRQLSEEEGYEPLIVTVATNTLFDENEKTTPPVSAPPLDWRSTG